MKYFLIFKASIKLIFEFFFSLIIYLPIIFFFRFKKKRLSNKILIIDIKFYDKKKNLLFNSDLTKSLQEYIDEKRLTKKIINFYPDENYQSSFKASINFIKFFYLNYPNIIFLKSDWMSKKTIDLSLHLFVILKFIENKVIFISRSGDPNWINNMIRGKVCENVFNAHISLPSIFIKKTNDILAFPEYGVPKHKLCEPSKNRPGNIFYIGRMPLNDNRSKTLEFLKKNNIKINIYGEDTKNFLNTNDFYQIYRNSKITINFPKQVSVMGTTNKFAFRGRVLDALSHGVLLFDQKNDFMDMLFKEGQHYVNYENDQDLLNKLRFYSNNYDNDGIKIAQQGFEMVKNKYNPTKTWSMIFDKI